MLKYLSKWVLGCIENFESMDVSSADDNTLLIPIIGIPAPIRDNRQPYQKQLAIYMILASTLFERAAFYSLAANFAPSLQLSGDDNCKTAFTGAFLFSGSSNFHCLIRWKLIFSILGISYLSTLIFAIVCDAKLGRGRTIIIGKSSSSRLNRTLPCRFYSLLDWIYHG